MTIAVIQNDPKVLPGLVMKAVRRAGLPTRCIDAHGGEPLPETEALTGAVVLGGTMCALDEGRHPFLRGVRGFMARALRTGLPLLGICLGGQILAEVAGGRVYRNRHGEKGIRQIQCTGPPTALFQGIGEAFIAFHWHDDSFDPPPGAPVLARTAACPHQAFQAAPRAFGLQFHPEVTPEIAAVWASTSGAPSPEVDELQRHWPEFEAVSLTLLDNFFRLVDSGRNG